MIFTDTHTHLYSEEFSEDRDLILQRAFDAGVSRLFVPSIDSSYTQKMYDLEALYVPPAIKPATEETLIIVPELRCFIPGIAVCIKRIGVRTKTSNICCSAFISLALNALLIPNPALLIRTSIS